jgi:protein transport protein HofC
LTGPDAKPPTPDSLEFESLQAMPGPEPWRLVHLLGLVLAAAVLLWLCMTLGVFFVVAAVILLLLVAVFTGGFVLGKGRIARQDSLLSIMAIAAEHGMPLAPAIAALAGQYRRRTHRRLLRLASLLNSGRSLSESLSAVPTLLSRDAVLMARIGEETGVLPRALRAAASARTSLLPDLTSIATRLNYVLFILIVMQSIVGFVMYFIMPKFEAIFYDFGLSLPAPTVLMIEGAYFVMDWAPPMGLFVLAEVVLLIFLPFKILGWWNFDVPFLDRIFRRRHTALILRALSLVVEAGKPIEHGVESLARNYPTRWVRRRLERVRADVQRGEDWCASLWRHGLIRGADGALLASARTTGNLAWAMRELADTSDRRLLVRLQAAIQLLFPVMVVSLGVLVLFLALAYFVPLVELINRLSG